MNKAVFVAGIGVISGIGNNVPECLKALRNGEAGVDKIKTLPTNHRDTLPAAEVKLNAGELAKISRLSASTSRTAVLSMIAAREALDDAGIDIAALRSGFVSAST